MTEPDLGVLRDPLSAVQKLLLRFDNQGLVIGGVAVSLLGSPRFTADVDLVLLLSLSRLSDLIAAAVELGLAPRIPDAESFARRHRVLLLKHSASQINVDISLGMLAFEEEAVARGALFSAGDLELRLPTVEDLIILKAVAHRPKDLLDIRTLAQANPKLDRKRIEHWVRAFGEAVELSQLWEDIAPLLGPAPWGF